MKSNHRGIFKNSWETFRKEDLKNLTTIMFLIISMIIILLGAADMGAMVRGQSNTDLSLSHIFFYLSVLYLSYYILYFIIYIKFLSEEQSKKYIDMKAMKLFVGIFSFSCLIFFAFLLKPIIVFIGNIDVDTWNGWLFILWLVTTIFLSIFVRYGIKDALSKFQIKIKPYEYIYCKCSKCKHEFVVDAKDIRKKNILINENDVYKYKLRSNN